MMVLRSRYTVLAVAASTFLTMAVADTAQAAAVPCGVYGSLFDGVYQPAWSNAIRGVTAQIEYNAPILCQNDVITGSAGKSLSTAWAMVRDHGLTASTFGWAQAGWVKAGSTSGYASGTHEYGQWARDCRWVPPACTSSAASYFTAYGANVRHFEFYYALRQADAQAHMYADGVHITNTDYDPVSLWTSDWRAEFAGETKHAETRMPGRVGDQTAFDFLKYYDQNGTPQFISTSLSHDPTAADYYFEPTTNPPPPGGGQGFKIYDGRN